MKILIAYYIFLIFIIISDVVPYNAFYSIVSVIVSFWILLMSFVVSSVKPFPQLIVNFKPPRRLPLFVFLYITCSFVYIEFYTGLYPLVIFSNILEGISNYSLYQAHFKENVIELSSLDKLPYILAGLYVKVFVFASFIYFRRGVIGLSLFFSVLFLYLLGGLARGTNFEVFELLLMFVFHYFWIRRTAINYKTICLSALLLLICLFVFSYFVDQRGDSGHCITADLCSNMPNTILNRLLLLLNGYFGFGFYYIGFFLTNMDFNSLIFGTLLPSWSHFCGPVIDCGVAWTPLFADLVSFIGLPLTISIICLVLYIFFKFRFSHSLPFQMLCFWCFLFLISLPVGKFVYTSSSNLLFPFASLFLYLIRFDKVSK